MNLAAERAFSIAIVTLPLCVASFERPTSIASPRIAELGVTYRF